MPDPGRYGPPPVPAIEPSPTPAPFPGPAPVPVPVPVPPPSPGPLLGAVAVVAVGTPARSFVSAGALTTGATTGGAGAGGAGAGGGGGGSGFGSRLGGGGGGVSTRFTGSGFATFLTVTGLASLLVPFSSAFGGGSGCRSPPPPPPPPGPGVATNTRRTRSGGCFLLRGGGSHAKRADEDHDGEKTGVECSGGRRGHAAAGGGPVGRREETPRSRAPDGALQQADRPGRLVQGEELA